MKTDMITEVQELSINCLIYYHGVGIVDYIMGEWYNKKVHELTHDEAMDVIRFGNECKLSERCGISMEEYNKFSLDEEGFI